MRFLFKIFIFFSYFLLIACTSGKNNGGEAFFEEEEGVEDFSQIEAEAEAEAFEEEESEGMAFQEDASEEDMVFQEDAEFDEEELEFMTPSGEDVSYAQNEEMEQDFNNNEDDEVFDQSSDVFDTEAVLLTI